MAKIKYQKWPRLAAQAACMVAKIRKFGSVPFNGAEMQNDIRKCKTTSKPGFSGLRPEKIFRFRTQLLQDGIETVAPWPVIDRFAAQSSLGALTSPHHGNDSKKGEKTLPWAPFGSTSAVSGT